MKREDLFGVNREMAAELADQIGHLAPHAKVLVATEPVDMITAEVVRHSGLNRRQVMGIGGCLDVARLRFFAARELGLSAEDISALVIGRHSDAMIVLLRYCSVSGLPLTSLLSEEQLESILEKNPQCRRPDRRYGTKSQRFLCSFSCGSGPSGLHPHGPAASHVGLGVPARGVRNQWGGHEPACGDRP
jgi:hypothetical protein